ncbi:hypothetical protein, partial [Candidatus Methylacidithermus pantelleriae]|uniref:hypothetical protein n=1 Tax=Candidatus Methylacidithermus pantelleriae TaxID=2744239 RepID=UPI001BD6417B
IKHKTRSPQGILAIELLFHLAPTPVSPIPRRGELLFLQPAWFPVTPGVLDYASRVGKPSSMV